MISDMKFRPKPTNQLGKRVFLLTLLCALAIFVVSLFLPSYQSVVQLLALVLLTISLYYYNRYVSTTYEYEITTDSDGTPVFVVSTTQGKRTSALCRIALWDVVGLERFAKENLSKRENDKTVSRHVLLPTLSPTVVTVVSVRSTYEKCELWLETSEDFDSYFLTLVRTAKENRPTEEDE